MPELIGDCPRCGASHVTFEVKGENYLGEPNGWQAEFELQCRCRQCKRSTVFVVVYANSEAERYLRQNEMMLYKGVLNDLMVIERYVSIRDNHTKAAPTDLPPPIHKVFSEGATCMAVDCYNAAGTMFRLCIDLATKSMLPDGEANGLNSRVRRNLGFRLPWLFGQGLIPVALQGLSSCIKEDGNDGAHEGTLEKADAEDIQDFTRMLLERLYTEPAQLNRAKERREARRAE